MAASRFACHITTDIDAKKSSMTKSLYLYNYRRVPAYTRVRRWIHIIFQIVFSYCVPSCKCVVERTFSKHCNSNRTRTNIAQANIKRFFPPKSNSMIIPETHHLRLALKAVALSLNYIPISLLCHRKGATILQRHWYYKTTWYGWRQVSEKVNFMENNRSCKYAPAISHPTRIAMLIMIFSRPPKHGHAGFTF